jgi:outer membrane protein assembly factor BamA
LQAGLTQRGYWLTQVRAGTDAFYGSVRVEERSRDAFFGIGNATAEADWTDYRLHRVSAGTHLNVRPAASWRLMAALEWSRTSTSAGSDAAHIDVDSAFAAPARPGFGIVSEAISVSGGLEYRAGARHAIERRGSWIATQYRWSGSRTSTVADFGVWRVGAGFELPFDHQRRSVVLALSLESLRRTSAGVVPFYVLPALGGATSLPSFRSERFRDRDAVLGTFEYRYRIWSEPGDALWIDAVLFTTAGMVAPRVVDAITTARVHQSTGFAFAVLSHGSALGRIAVSKGADGIGITFAMSGGL